MKKWFYRMPAILVCLIYGFLTLLVGGFGGYQIGAWLNIGLTVLSAIVLSRGHWWGCVFGAALGALFVYQDTSPILGMAVIGYYVIAGILCIRTKN